MTLFSLLFSFSGRIGRTTFFLALIFVWSVFFNINFLLERAFGNAGSLLIYIPFLWAVFAISIKRYHDTGKDGKYLLLLLVPLFGPVWVFLELLIRKGQGGANRFGESPRAETIDYLTVKDSKEDLIVNDVTQINPIKVDVVHSPTTIDEVCGIIRSTTGKISIGGGRFSMGGQVGCEGSTHIDLRRLNKIVTFHALNKTIRVQAGVRWCDIQRTIDNQNLSVKIMQTYANFTVGGSLSVNCHGRYIGLGPLVLSVRSIVVVLANGQVKEADPVNNRDIFYGAIGGYGALGVIVEAELELTENVRVMRDEVKLNRALYLDFFKKNIRSNSDAVFHNADLYPPHYRSLRAVTWSKTDAPATTPYKLMPVQKSYPVHRYFYWAFSETLTGKWRREHIIEPILYSKKKVHWRNYEAGYDVRELEPSSRIKSTYVLQEYFVPIDKFDEFVPQMGEILRRYNVNVINISVRHALSDPGTFLAWAPREVFAFVLYYKQNVTRQARERVGEWTRALIDAVLQAGGTYYLPYQPHATDAQFHQAYPRAKEFFSLKQKLDPEFRFTNALWNKYYKPN